MTNRPSQREADWAYGPFASRAAAERYAEEALKLFLLRRCTDDLDPDPSHPGCVYSEMKMCLAPCYKGCTDERYGEEAAAVEEFLATRGESRLVVLRTERDEASARTGIRDRRGASRPGAARGERARAGSGTGAPAEPVARGDPAGLGQSRRSGRLPFREWPAARPGRVFDAGHAHPERAVGLQFALRPATGARTRSRRDQRTGIRATRIRDQQTEPSELGGIHPQTLKSLEAAPDPAAAATKRPARGVLEARLDEVLSRLAAESESEPPSATTRQGHLALLKRWYYRPEVRRPGEIFFPDAEGALAGESDPARRGTRRGKDADDRPSRVRK